MAADPWAIDASAGAPAYNAGEMRLLTTTPFLAGAGASLGVRSGVRPSGSGTDLLVQAQASPNMTVKVNTGVTAVQGAISATQGAYTWALDALLASLTIAAAHATLARTDLVVVRIRDANVDTSGARDGAVIVITGTAGGGIPTPPTDATYFELARIAVGAAVTTIVAGNITDRRAYTTGLGGILPCNAATEPAATTVPAGQIVYRTDLGQYKNSDGAAYQHLAWAPPYLFVRRTADTTIASNATLADDLYLFVSVAANAMYDVRAFIIYGAGTLPDMKVGWSAPSGSTFDWNVGGPASNQDTGTGIPYNAVNTLAGTDTLGGAGASPTVVARPSGLLITAGTSGLLRFRWAQNVSDPSGTSVKTNSYLLLTRIG